MAKYRDDSQIPKNHIGWTVWLYGLFALAVIVLSVVGFAIAGV